ncbi:hypothetical protein J8F10_13465 [Gemmata sp. G18]|uniref:Uncharacterized protein n=1 Tax=Gemmata palustris TaxID=2822762 RepID=A0ABS5BTU2_9BACT|nr:hypothetical protein [Gemmata palustris]MBP3956293.1 hypothetical protein [Gemmata palustris]
MKTHAAHVFTGFAILWGTAVTGAPLLAQDKEAEEEKLWKARPPQKQAAAYREQFEKVGRAGLPALMKDKDTSLALQAAWEAHKKIIDRTKPVPFQEDETYDPNELKKFLEFLKERTKAPVPDWWAKGVLDLDVMKGRAHMYIHSRIKPDLKEVKISDRTWYIREGSSLALNDDTWSYKFSDVTLLFPKAFLLNSRPNALTDLTAEKITCLATYPVHSGGFRSRVAGFEKKSGTLVWDAPVWAVDRRVIIGPGAAHRVELTTKGETVFVFGAEIWGLYAEGFDLTTGKNQFRFCTSYWGNFSEKWDVK